MWLSRRWGASGTDSAHELNCISKAKSDWIHRDDSAFAHPPRPDAGPRTPHPGGAEAPSPWTQPFGHKTCGYLESSHAKHRRTGISNHHSDCIESKAPDFRCRGSRAHSFARTGTPHCPSSGRPPPYCAPRRGMAPRLYRTRTQQRGPLPQSSPTPPQNGAHLRLSMPELQNGTRPRARLPTSCGVHELLSQPERRTLRRALQTGETPLPQRLKSK